MGMPNIQSGKTIALSVVMPAYQEEENLRILLPRVIEVLQKIAVSCEILVIDTMLPMDSTQQLCNTLGVHYFARKGGNAYGDAVRTGVSLALGEHMILMDSDGSHAPEWIAKLYADRIGHDVVIASRYVENGSTENSLYLVLMSRILNWTYSLILGIHCKDISNSYRLYVGNQIRALNLKCNNFDIVEEILVKLVRNNNYLKIQEIPFTFKERLFGRTKRKLFLFVITYVFTLIKLRFFV